MPAYDPQNTRAKQLRKRKRGYRPRNRLGGGGLPDVVNPRSGKFEWGRVLKPDSRS